MTLTTKTFTPPENFPTPMHEVGYTPNSQLEMYLTNADASFSKGKILAAIFEIQKALEIEPHDPSIIKIYGNLLLSAGDINSARLEFQKAVKIAPDYGPAHLDLAGVLYYLGLFDEAEKHVRTFLSINPQDTNALALLARLTESNGRSGEDDLPNEMSTQNSVIPSVSTEDSVEQAVTLPWTGERYLPWLGESEGAEIHYEHLHRYRFAYQLAAGKRVLDLASGEGYGSAMLAEMAAEVVGIDISEEAVRHASDKYQRNNLVYRTGSILQVPLEGSTLFDLIVCFEALEHVADHDQLMSEVKRLLKPDGLFLISTPNKSTYSDHDDFDNPYHVRELYLDEFKTLLSRYFENYRILGQKSYPASYLYSYGERSPFANIYNLDKEGGYYSFRSEVDPEPRYYLAVVGGERTNFADYTLDTVLVDTSRSLFDQYNSQIKDYRTILADRNAHIANLELMLEDQKKLMLEEQKKLHSEPIASKEEGDILRGRIINARRADLQKIVLTIQAYNNKYKRSVTPVIADLFDENYYVQKYRDVVETGNSPLWHFLETGVHEGRNPNPLFDTYFYRSSYPEMLASGQLAVEHFLLIGAEKGYNPHPMFDTSFYLKNNPDVVQAGFNPLVHYICYGAYERRDPHPQFSTDQYLKQYPELITSGENPLVHYLRSTRNL